MFKFSEEVDSQNEEKSASQVFIVSDANRRVFDSQLTAPAYFYAPIRREVYRLKMYENEYPEVAAHAFEEFSQMKRAFDMNFHVFGWATYDGNPLGDRQEVHGLPFPEEAKKLCWMASMSTQQLMHWLGLFSADELFAFHAKRGEFLNANGLKRGDVPFETVSDFSAQKGGLLVQNSQIFESVMRLKQNLILFRDLFLGNQSWNLSEKQALVSTEQLPNRHSFDGSETAFWESVRFVLDPQDKDFETIRSAGLQVAQSRIAQNLSDLIHESVTRELTVENYLRFWMIAHVAGFLKIDSVLDKEQRLSLATDAMEVFFQTDMFEKAQKNAMWPYLNRAYSHMKPATQSDVTHKKEQLTSLPQQTENPQVDSFFEAIRRNAVSDRGVTENESILCALSELSLPEMLYQSGVWSKEASAAYAHYENVCFGQYPKKLKDVIREGVFRNVLLCAESDGCPLAPNDQLLVLFERMHQDLRLFKSFAQEVTLPLNLALVQDENQDVSAVVPMYDAEKQVLVASLAVSRQSGQVNEAVVPLAKLIVGSRISDSIQALYQLIGTPKSVSDKQCVRFLNHLKTCLPHDCTENLYGRQVLQCHLIRSVSESLEKLADAHQDVPALNAYENLISWYHGKMKAPMNWSSSMAKREKLATHTGALLRREQAVCDAIKRFRNG